MEPEQPSSAWHLLDPEQRQGMHWLVARMNRHRVPDARQRLAANHGRQGRMPGSHPHTPHVDTGTTEPKDTAEQWRATTTRRSAQDTALVVDEMPQPDKLERLYRKLRDDKEFKHLADAANFVPGEGVWPGPAAMLVGEAPGAHEDKLGRPFVGRSGNFLDNCMWEAGLKRADCFVTNVVKWRPPANRTPTLVEIEAAIPHLRKEVTTVLPDGGLVVLLGAVPLNVVDSGRKISKCHGEPFTHAKWTFIPMYHPSFVMRPTSPFNRADYMKDWAKIKELRAA